eukprot:symbB.v1.2.020126.t1/scaffold1676.1/size106311/3
MAVFALMMWKVRAMADNTERKPSFRRIFRILTESSAMTMAWLLMYWVQWLFWYFHQNADGSHRSGRHAALMYGSNRYMNPPVRILLNPCLLDAAAVGVFGALLSYVNNGEAAAEGWLVGAVFGIFYLLLLQQDVNVITVQVNPFNLTNPWRILRFLLPFTLVLGLGLQHANEIGLEEWWHNVTWQPGLNFTGVVTSPQELFAALLSYAVVTAVLPVRGLFETLPEARTLVKAVPGSLGVALDLADKASRPRPEELAVPEDVEVVPVLLVTGPRGCGKSTLAQQLMQQDSRFQEPEWVATKPCSGIGSSRQRIVTPSDYQALEQTRSLAVSYRPAGDDLEEVEVGLPAMSVLATAQKNGACILDVDPPTARYILSYNFEPAVSAVFPETKTELRIVTVWVSMRTLDEIMHRNRTRLESQGISEGEILDVTSDMEWALTSGLDFTILNEDVDVAVMELEHLREIEKYGVKIPTAVAGKGAPRWNGRKGQSAYVATEDATGETDYEYDLDEIYEAEENEAYDYMTPMLLMHHGSRKSSTGRMNLGRMLHTKQTEDAAQDEEYEVKRLQPTWMLEEDLLIWPVMAVPPTSSGVSTSPPPSYSFSNGKLTKGKGKGGKSKWKGGQRPVFEKVTEGHFGSCVPAVASLVFVIPANTPFLPGRPVLKHFKIQRDYAADKISVDGGPWTSTIKGPREEYLIVLHTTGDDWCRDWDFDLMTDDTLDNFTRNPDSDIINLEEHLNATNDKLLEAARAFKCEHYAQKAPPGQVPKSAIYKGTFFNDRVQPAAESGTRTRAYPIWVISDATIMQTMRSLLGVVNQKFGPKISWKDPAAVVMVERDPHEAKDKNNLDERKMSQAIASTVLVYAGLMGLVFVAKRMEKKVSDFTELCNAFVLQTGFCWEMAIYVGLVDSFTAKMANPTGRRVAAIVWICFLLVMIAPAWFWYILPKSQKGADAKSEGDATVKDKENDAPKEAAPAAAAPAESTPAAAAEPTPAAPAAEETPAPPTTEEPKVETPAEEAS